MLKLYNHAIQVHILLRINRADYLPGFILTVDEGRWEVEPGEKEESTADTEEELRE